MTKNPPPDPKKPALLRRERKRPARPSRIVAYDLETSPIKAGSPRPLYLTAWAPGFEVAEPIRDFANLHHVLTHQLLTPENSGVRFAAWNGNRFDAYFIAAALVRDDRYRLIPLLTKSRELRGLDVLSQDSEGQRWNFVCGMAMLGIDCTLSELLQSFAPELPKLPAPDWGVGFDPSRPEHCAYAMRDSEGLWQALDRAQRIVLGEFGEPLGLTMGGTGIKVFTASIPDRVVIKPPDDEAETVIRQHLNRGGFVFCKGRFEGPVWKYDINQAYSAAMRDCPLPCGSMLYDRFGPEEKDGAYMVRLSAIKRDNTVPFYVKATDSMGRIRAAYARTIIRDAWLTSDEHRQLLAEGWEVEEIEHWQWARTFSMRDFVDRLESMRAQAPGGPQGPTGRMVKSIGTNSYGKTAEQPDGIEYCLARECPPGFLPWYEDDDADPVEHVFWRPQETPPRPHHQPQIAAFITAWVRMEVRRAALLDPLAWLYADTDCVMFSRDMSASLDIDPNRYGAWKVESEGEMHRIIMPKVYQSARKNAARGMNVQALTGEHFEKWFEGQAPNQTQVQLRNFLDVMRGADMYRAINRRGSVTTGE
jgi:hypothetical protein